MTYSLEHFPKQAELENLDILRKLVSAHRFLAELKGVCRSIPNQGILINTLVLQEAKDSSEIENIITTHDELFREAVFPEYAGKAAAKEVQNYASALHKGFDLLHHDGLLTNNHILAIQEELERSRAGFRKLPGTELKNDKTGQTVYMPPQHPDEIIRLMAQLERFINEPDNEIDPLIRMAVIHHRFESIHPFYDGNGRTGRILNLLILQKEQLLNLPVLYLSRYITSTKAQYYQLLQTTRDTGDWVDWCVYITRGIAITAKSEVQLVKNLRTLMHSTKHRLRDQLPKIYNPELLNNLFRHPYTKIEFVEKDLGISRITAAKHLDALAQHGFVEKTKVGRTNFYINRPLFELLTEIKLSD